MPGVDECLQAKSGGDMSSGGFTARAQGAGDRNTNAASAQGSKPSNNSGSGNIGAGKGGSTGDSNTGAQVLNLALEMEFA
ncbi:hypothetical protein N7478_009589 [Penicillium angulare]|uniref:uncharacterized protein n=1 Tax=Penicillium angulare TaxID=116970 RepID=UPI00254222FA|nr:uncharacterized protein N7478_009589 [Penicillium angulare]KAJ5266781.1 hypothetical protein N7478_009589 [Penicillium angulare]